MTTIQSNKAISILNENHFLPNGIEMNTRLKLIDIASNNSKYWGYKYADDGEHYDNSVVAFKFEHSMVEKPFWIVLFKGAQAKVSSVNETSAFWKLPVLDDAIYTEDGITLNDTSDGVETVMSIAEKFNYLWFEEDEASEEEPLIWNDSDLLYWLANEFENILNIKINLSVPHKQIKEHHIQELEKALADAKVALLNNHRSESISATKIEPIKKVIKQESLLMNKKVMSKSCNYDNRTVIDLPSSININELDSKMKELKTDIVVFENKNYIIGIYNESLFGYALWECEV